jgi:Protein of unknown function (DUF3341)
MKQSAKERHIMGVFTEESGLISAIHDLKASRFEIRRVHSPFSNHEIMEALKIKKSKVGWMTLSGGAFGFFAGLWLASFTALKWKFVVGGHPVLAWFPFLIIGFELTILFSVAATMVGMLWQARLPEFGTLGEYDPRLSGSHFGIMASCKDGEESKLVDLFRKRGGEAQVFNDEGIGS